MEFRSEFHASECFYSALDRAKQFLKHSMDIYHEAGVGLTPGEVLVDELIPLLEGYGDINVEFVKEDGEPVVLDKDLDEEE